MTPARGDVVIVADRHGDATGKPRPAIVVQSEKFRGGNTITVVPLTSDPGGYSYARVPVTPTEALPLAGPCFAMIERITTVRRAKVRGPIGQVSASELDLLDGRLMVFLGLG